MQRDIFLVTHHDPGRPRGAVGGGRELVSAVNYQALRDVAGDHLHVFTVPRTPVKGIRGLPAALQGHIDGLNPRTIGQALDIIRERRIMNVVVDGSNFGAFVRSARRRFPAVSISTFFHNAEARFFLGALRRTPSPRSAAVLAVNYLAERMAVQHSDHLLCLSARDGAMLKRLYGRDATHVFPLALHDTYLMSEASTHTATSESYLLFVGGAFYANISGMEWFARNVAPHLPVKTVVVGKGFELQRQQLQVSGMVEVIGGVETLAPWYRNAMLVVAPIFDGSGMKTKVAEALMYGKRIIGTPEAFSGYESLIGKPEWVCNSADQFVSTLRRQIEDNPPPFDPALRRLYEQHFSLDAARHRFASVMGAAA